ncbi:hypothetical protein C1H46_004192 [Malus baccata]|uniref:Uncharacterized protein n=1 Tax=Malus baccata TaxID=106549 RepID=A0A540NI86_MALBA|nr:hypothetical protein C1H46_004192 [Malus baccata]
MVRETKLGVDIRGLDALWAKALGIEASKSLASMAVTTTTEANSSHDACFLLTICRSDANPI